MISPTFSQSLKVPREPIFSAKRPDWHSPPSFRVSAFYNGREDHIVHVHVNIVDKPATCYKNLVNVGQVITEF